MKNKILKKGTVLLTILICGYVLIGFKYVNIHDDTTKALDGNIIGTWISEEDNNWKLVVTSNKLYSYYTGDKIDTCSYSISNTSPQCGIIVPIDSTTNYLKTINDSDTTDKICYEMGLSSTHLSLRVVDMGQPSVFVKQ